VTSKYRSIGENVGVYIEDGVLHTESSLTANILTGRKTQSGARVVAEVSGGQSIDLGFINPSYKGLVLTFRITSNKKPRHPLD